MAVRPNSPQQAPAAGADSAQTSSGTIATGLALVPSGAHQGKPSLPLTRTFTLIGSRSRAHLHLVSATVSKSHTAVIVTRSGLYVRDLASRMHTVVNGQAQREIDLKHGDKLTVGNFSFRVEAKVFANAKPGRMAPKASLIVQGADFPVLFDGRTLLIGRRPTCDVPLVEESVSTVHALIFEVDGRHYVRDLGSRTGTLVNGKPIHQHPLNFGDELRVGDTVMRFAPEGATEEDYAGGAAALEDEAAIPVEPHPVPAWEPKATEIAARADELLPVTPAAEHKAPASEADDLDLIPLAEEEPAPVGDWGRLRGKTSARPAEPVAEVPHEVEAAPPEAPDVEPIDFGVSEEPLPLAEPVADVAEETPAAAEAPPAEDLGLEFAEAAEPEPAKAEELGDLDLSGLSLEPVAAEQAAAAEIDEPVAPLDEPLTAAADAPADLDLDVPAPPLDELAAVEEEAPAPAPKKSRGGKKASAKKPAPAAKEKPAKKGKESWWDRKRKQQQAPTTPEPVAEPEAPVIDEPPAAPAIAAGAAATAGAVAAAAEAGTAEAPVPAKELEAPAVAEVEAPAPELEPPAPEVELPAAEVELPPAELESHGEELQAPAAELETPVEAAELETPGEELQAPAAELETPVEPEAPATQAATSPSAEEGSITGDDLSFLDDLLAAESKAPAPATSDADEALDAPVHAGPKLDLSFGDIEAGSPEFAGETQSPTSGTSTAAADEPVDSLAGLDLSNLATGSGLDLGGVVDSVELPEENLTGTMLPPDATALDDVDSLAPAADETVGAAPSANTLDLPEEFGAEQPGEVAGQRVASATEQDAEVLDFTEPTPESALDLSISDSIVADDSDGGAATPSEVPAEASLSDTSFGKAVEALADPSLAPVDEPAGAVETEEAPVLSFDEPEERFETQADKLIAQAASADDGDAGEQELSSIDDVFALDESEDAAPAATVEAPESDELSLDTLAVAEPEPIAEPEPVADELQDEEVPEHEPHAAQRAEHAPLVSDLISATEDEAAAEIAADPAGISEDDAAEALNFDLESAAEEASESPEGAAEENLGEPEPIDLDALPPEERAQWTGPVDDLALQTGDEPLPLDEAETSQSETEAPAAPAADGDAASTPARFDPLFGMGRDAGTFIGGMPLPLASSTTAPAAPAEAELPELARQLPPPELVQSADDLPSLEELGLEAPPPPAPAAKVDTEVEAIDFTTEPVAEAPAVPAPEPAKAAPRVVAFNDSNKSRVIPKPPPAAKNIPPRNQPGATRGPAWGPFDLGLADGAVEIPPFNQSAPGEVPKAGPLTTAFDGLALEDDEPTDNLLAALGAPASDPIFGLPSRPPTIVGASSASKVARGNEEVPPADAPGQAEASDQQGDQDDDANNQPPPSGGAAADDDIAAALAEAPIPEGEEEVPAAALPAKPGRARPPGYTPPAPAEAPANPYPPAAPRKRRRWGIKFFLFLMLISAGLAVGGVYALQPRFAPRTVEVSGYLKFEGLDSKGLSEFQRKAEVAHQQDLLKALPERAREVLMGLDEHVEPGFLGSATPKDAQAYAAIVDSAKVPDGTNKLALYYHGTDKDGDLLRMRALLQALYTKNADLTDDVATKQGALAKAKVDLDSTLRELEELKKRADSGNKLNESAVLASDQKVSELKATGDALRAAASKARLRVAELEAELERATAASDAAAPAKDATAAVPSTAPKNPADDTQLKEMAQRLADLTARLDQSKGIKTAEATAAAQKLNQALTQFDKEIATAQSELKGDDQLAQYVSAAQTARKQISRIYERLVSQQKDFSELLNAKKASLAEKLQTRIQEAWASDTELKKTQETLALKERHRNAATASGLTADVASLDKQIKDLNAQMEARRELIGHASAADVRDQQQLVDTLLQMMEKDRASNDKEMAEVFDNFNKQLPSIEKLPEEQKKLATALAAQSAELNTAREQYLKASATASADDTKAIETELAQTQAKIDARKRQIADAAAQDLSTQQQQEREFRIAQARTNVEEAKAAWERAEAASSANYKSWSEAKDEAEAAKTAFRRSQDDAKRLAALDGQRKEKLALVEKLDQEVKGKIRPIAVDNDSVSYTLGDDTRPVNALIALIAVVGIFGTLIYVETHQSERQDEDEQAPFAATAYADEFSGPAPRFADIDETARAAGLPVPDDVFETAPPEGGHGIAV